MSSDYFWLIFLLIIRMTGRCLYPVLSLKSCAPSQPSLPWWPLTLVFAWHIHPWGEPGEICPASPGGGEWPWQYSPLPSPPSHTGAQAVLQGHLHLCCTGVDGQHRGTGSAGVQDLQDYKPYNGTWSTETQAEQGHSQNKSTGSTRVQAVRGHRQYKGTGSTRAQAVQGHRHFSDTGSIRAQAVQGHRHFSNTGSTRAQAGQGHML